MKRAVSVFCAAFLAAGCGWGTLIDDELTGNETVLSESLASSGVLPPSGISYSVIAENAQQSVLITWNSVANAKEYELTVAGDYAATEKVETAQYRFPVELGDEGFTAEVRIKTVNINGVVSSPSAPLPIVIGNDTVYSEFCHEFWGSRGTETSVVLSYAQAKDADSYRIERRRTGADDTAWEVIAARNIPANSSDSKYRYIDQTAVAGYRYDYRESEPGHIVLAPDGTHEIAGYLQFESWGDIQNWLEDTITEGTDISERVDRAMYPFKYDYTLEEEMFRGNGDRYAIYHVDEDTPGKQHLFMNMAMVKEDGITIDAANYKCVYSGRLHENEKLDDLYAVFNDNPPADYKAHSMSVSDVIITNRGGDMQAYYVDRFGFAELPDFAAQREKILDIVPEIENVDYENDLTCISFYAAECAEFPVMGEVHYDLTLPEALEAYEKIPSERMHGLKCVGFDLKDGSDYEGMQSLMIEGKIQKEFLNSIPGFRENSYVQNAISRVEKYLEERHPNVENPLESNKKVDNEKNISKEKNEKELNIQMKPIPKKKRGEMSL